MPVSRIPILVLVAALLLGGSPAAQEEGESGRPAVGSRVGDLRFVDRWYLERSLSELGEARAYAIVFTRSACPVAQRVLPKLAELERAYRDRGVRFLALSAGPTETVVEVAAQGVDAGCGFPFGKDLDGRAAAALGALRTPEVCVLDAEFTLRYRGRVDDQFRLGGARPAPTREDLREALDELLAGRAVSVAETPVDGCRITLDPFEPDASLGWNRDTRALIERHCVDCHYAGGEAPFALQTHAEVAERADALAEAVERQLMPPWFASPAHGELSDVRLLPDDERRALVGWLRAGAPAGGDGEPPEPIDAPAGALREGEWRIGEPDLVLTAPTREVIPATGYVPYRYTFFLHVFREDTWIEDIEIRPENPRVLHHANLAWVTPGEEFRQENFLTGQVPGGLPMDLPEGTAVRIPAGSILTLQIHYVTTGREEVDRLRVGLRFPRVPVQERLRHMQVGNFRFEIPPGVPDHEVTARRRLSEDASCIGMYVHMHLRGADMRFVAHAPDAAPETLLLVPNYSFDWQRAYRFPEGGRELPAGTRIECVAHFDNSPFNPFNPDPAAAVRFGPQTYHEMHYGFLFYVHTDERLGIEVDPSTGRVRAGEAPGTTDDR